METKHLYARIQNGSDITTFIRKVKEIDPGTAQHLQIVTGCLQKQNKLAIHSLLHRWDADRPTAAKTSIVASSRQGTALIEVIPEFAMGIRFAPSAFNVGVSMDPETEIYPSALLCTFPFSPPRIYSDCPLAVIDGVPFAPWIWATICSSSRQPISPEDMTSIMADYLKVAAQYNPLCLHFAGISSHGTGWFILGYLSREQAVNMMVQAEARILLSEIWRWKHKEQDIICVPTTDWCADIYPVRSGWEENAIVCEPIACLIIDFDARSRKWKIWAHRPLLVFADTSIDDLVNDATNVRHLCSAMSTAIEISKPWVLTRAFWDGLSFISIQSGKLNNRIPA